MKLYKVIQAALLPLLITALPRTLAANWKAGLAKADITPDRSIWLAGFGARTKPSEGVLHPIYVKALALQDETGAINVLVTSDLLGFNRDMAAKVAQQAHSRFGLPRNRLAINSSQASRNRRRHNGPEPPPYSCQISPDQAVFHPQSVPRKSTRSAFSSSVKASLKCRS